MQKKFKTFLYVLTKSLTEPAYYRDILFVDFGFSLKYFLVFFLLLTSINTALFSFRTYPQIKSVSLDTLDHLASNYPPDLTVSYQDGQLTADGVEFPHTLDFNTQLGDIVNSSHHYDYLLTLAPDTDETVNKSLFTFGDSQLIFRRTDDSKQSFTYTQVFPNNFQFTHPIVTSEIDTLRTELDTLFSFLPAAFFAIMLMFAPLGAFLLVALYSMLTYTAAGIISRRLTYKKSLQIGLHTITFAETASLLQELLFTRTPMPSIYSLAFFGATLLVLLSFRQAPTK